MTPLESYHHFPLALGSQGAELLDTHTRRLLDSLGCGDEPTTWSPPATWADVAELPGRDPTSVPAEQVEVLLRQKLPPGQVADRLGISLDHVRLLIRQNPPHIRPRSTGRRTKMRNPFPAQLTPERLPQLVVDEGRSLRSIISGAVTRLGRAQFQSSCDDRHRRPFDISEDDHAVTLVRMERPAPFRTRCVGHPPGWSDLDHQSPVQRQ